MSENFSPVSFDLTETLTMPHLSKTKGFARQHVLLLFEQLEKAGYGNYTRGRRGKGNCAKFEPNKKCPQAFTILVENTTLPKRKQNQTLKVESNESGSDKSSEEIENKKEEKIVTPENVGRQVLTSLWSLSKNIVRDINSDFVGYECHVFGGSFIVLHRVRGGGENTIEDALKNVWDSVDARVGLKDKPKTKRVEGIASTLRGNGFYILDRTE